MSLVTILGIGLSPASSAFFPAGGFHPINNTPQFARWSIENIDATGNGQVVSPFDGVLVTIDVGDDGFTAAEAEAIRDAFQVWQDVPGAYMAFRFQEIEGPFPVSDGDQLGAVNDPFNSVTLGDAGGAIAVTYRSAVIGDETVVTDPVTGQQFLVRGPQILEADIILSEAFYRPEGVVNPDPDDLTTLVPRTAETIRQLLPRTVGLFSGLSFTPLNNTRDEEIEILIIENEQPVTVTVSLVVEDAIMPMRGADGVVRFAGATPTMFNAAVFVDEPDGVGRLHTADLAYDDIAGIMFLYPRIEQEDELFTITQQARTRARPGFTSSPIVGAHAVAWVDHDRNPTTVRIPLFSTMTGLYNNEVPIGELSGRFQMFGLFKRIIDGNGNLFSPDYVISIEPLPADAAKGFDSMHTPLAERPDSAYNTLFPFEVYNEAGNLFNRNNVRFGTPLYFDTVRRQVVSRTSGLTLAQQLPRNAPMFGEEGNVCFFDLIGDPTNGAQPPGGLAALTGVRSFRDNVMLRSRLGAAATDIYYRIAPPIASYLAANEIALASARNLFNAIVWLAMLPLLIWAALAGVFAFMLAHRLLRRRVRTLAAGSAAAMMLVLATTAAHATIVLDSPQRMVEQSDAIIAGEVTAVHSYYSTDMLPATIVTDVSIMVLESMKGGLNKSSTVTVRMPGGQVGDHIVESSNHPRFREGEKVVLMLTASRKDIGLTLSYGSVGTFRMIRAEGGEADDKGATRLVASAVGAHAQIPRIARAVNEVALKRGLLKSDNEAKPDEFSLESFGAFVQEAVSRARN